ncbi:MAG: hypothetical protein A2Y67_01240 [Candidatus Buchananbacteria bacterium RBG_13_39_9]|uniref:Uncharacterized protein n=1 Tax=Candidatus Buchananbacteria bacterium RBG_13_39_9 TaxID=1797531 RepID=A0A1G1XN50_9BACT|nr:MAG: hypothetical protein A2Y67_01240 [Candidatus Buchananbacteria bacterium RBG_13_39_9]
MGQDRQRFWVAAAANVALPYWDAFVPPPQEQLPFAVASTSCAEIYLGPRLVAHLHGAPALYRLVRGRRRVENVIVGDDSVFHSIG